MSTFYNEPRGSEEKKVSDGLNVEIPLFETISQGFMGINSYTQYKIVTMAQNIPMLDSGAEYDVWRRFSDFEWLHNSLIEQDEYKGLVLPSLPNKSYLTRQDEAFLEARRVELNGYLKQLAEHKVIKRSRTFHLFLTTKSDEEFNNLKLEESTLKTKLFEYAQKIRNFDMDHFVTNISQYFDSEEPNDYALSSQIKSHMQSLLDYEKLLQNIKSCIEQHWHLSYQMSDTMTQIALGIEKFRLNSESYPLDQLFKMGGTLDDDIEDLDTLAMIKNNSRDSDKIADEYDKIDRLPFMKNVYPALKQGAKAKESISEDWKILLNGLNSQISKIQGLKQALKRRNGAISAFKTNLAVLNKKKVKQASEYTYESIHGEIEELEKESKVLDLKIKQLNQDLSSDLCEFSLSDIIKGLLQNFLSKYKVDIAQGFEDVNSVKATIAALN